MHLPGMGEMIIILIVVFVFFGARRLPELGGAVGQAIKNFKRGIKSEDDPAEVKKKLDEAEQKNREK